MLTGYRTYIVALLPTIFGILQMTDWDAFMKNPKAGLIGVGSGLLMAVMRSVTTTPPGQKP